MVEIDVSAKSSDGEVGGSVVDRPEVGRVKEKSAEGAVASAESDRSCWMENRGQCGADVLQ